jgi:predicted RNA binding protein YcfA (HicA-like mRNA interferase family)
MKFRQLRRLLWDRGYRPQRQSGSHEIWVHPYRPGSIIVAGNDGRDVPMGTLKSIMRELARDQE